MEKTCYCCDAIGTTKDHVPPIAFFPKGIKPDYVPSCEKHNSGKSDVDEYLRFILTSSVRNVPHEVLERTVRGIMRHAINNSKTLEKYGVICNDDKITISSGVDIDPKFIFEGMEKIAQGIYYYDNNCMKKMMGSCKVYPIFSGINHPCWTPRYKKDLEKRTLLTSQEMKEQEMIGKYPDIFCYQIKENDEIIIVNMLFYKECVVSVTARKLST